MLAVSPVSPLYLSFFFPPISLASLSTWVIFSKNRLLVSLMLLLFFWFLLFDFHFDLYYFLSLTWSLMSCFCWELCWVGECWAARCQSSELKPVKMQVAVSMNSLTPVLWEAKGQKAGRELCFTPGPSSPIGVPAPRGGRSPSELPEEGLSRKLQVKGPLNGDTCAGNSALCKSTAYQPGRLRHQDCCGVSRFFPWLRTVR